jgi:hypothetical protein
MGGLDMTAWPYPARPATKTHTIAEISFARDEVSCALCGWSGRVNEWARHRGYRKHRYRSPASIARRLEYTREWWRKNGVEYRQRHKA